jgi:hypothetical protein
MEVILRRRSRAVKSLPTGQTSRRQGPVRQVVEPGHVVHGARLSIEQDGERGEILPGRSGLTCIALFRSDGRCYKKQS